MLSCIKKSFLALITNFKVPLLLLAYLICFILFASKILAVSDILVFGILLFVFFILTVLFFAGWFNSLKTVLKENENDVFYESFMLGIVKYSLSLLGSLFLFILIFGIFNFLLAYAADSFIGKIDFLKNFFEEGKYTIEVLLSALSSEQVEILFKRELLFIICAFLMHSMTLFWLPSIYYDSEFGRNPFKIFLNSLVSFFKKPFITMCLTLFSNILVLSFMVSSQLLPDNSLFVLFCVLSFAYGITFFLMLIFSYYEKNFSNNCDNGTDCIGEKQDIN